MGTQNYSSNPVLVASGTLAADGTYGKATQRVGDYLDIRGGAGANVFAQFAGTLGSATLQPQISLDGATWANHGSALSAAGLAKLDPMPATAFLRFLVSNDNDITDASLTLAA